MSLDGLRVALVHDWLTGMRGGEMVLEQILEMFPRAPIYTLFHFPGSVSSTIEEREIHTSFLQRAPGIQSHYRRYLPLFPKAIEKFDLSGYDLVLSTSHCVAKGVVPAAEATHLCYCFTPMRYAWDQEKVYFPETNGLTAKIRSRILARLRTWDVATSTRVDQFVADSSFVAGRIQRYYEREAQVLHAPVDTDFYTPGEGADGDYFIAVSALSPYKRVETAIAASREADVDLVVVGDGPERERLEGLAGSRVRFEGRVSAERLRALYRGARAFVQPGIEDFGIATVEALACGTPVIAQGEGGVLDIVTEGEDGLLYHGGVAELVAAMDKFGKMTFKNLDIRSRAERFSRVRFKQGLQSAVASEVRLRGKRS